MTDALSTRAGFGRVKKSAMAWNYHFIELSKAEKHHRRQTLNRYALYAQLSALVPVAVILLYRLVKWAVSERESRNGDYAAVPSSPVRKVQRRTSLGTWSSRSRRARWWLGEDVVVAGMVFGQRDRTSSFAGLGSSMVSLGSARTDTLSRVGCRDFVGRLAAGALGAGDRRE